MADWIGVDMIDATPETWRPVVGYEGYYEVSDQGRVRSVSRVLLDSLGRSRPFRGKVLSPARGRHGHRYVTLKRGHGGCSLYVHHLVMEAFVGPRPQGQEVCHNNGDPSDNRPENLRYDTHAENIADAVRHGTHTNQNKGKTHCKRGHAFTPENTRRYADRRVCITCHTDYNRQRNQRMKLRTA